jgi:outer membrane protein assembly factor BamA
LAQSSLAPITLPLANDEEARRCLESTCRNAPLREKLSAIHLGTKYLRGIVGGFEQGAGIGGGVQLTSADVLPSLELRATALTSSRFYRRFDLEGYLPNIGSSRNHADVWFSYMRRESDFFGIGPRISRDLKTNFATEQRSYQGSLYRDIADHFQGGVYTQVTNSHSSQGKINTDTPIDESFSSTRDQPFAPWIPGFLSNAKILSYGGFLEYDTRDNTFGLPRGLNLYGRVASDDGLDNHAAFADYGWVEGEFDIRGYAPLGSPKTSLALRSKGEFKKPKGGSQIPFYDLSWLGGREYVRGYDLYRFRGNNVLLFSTELRQTVYSKTDSRGVDVFAFADSGQVWGDARSATDPMIRANQNFTSSNWHSGVGGGLQYRHSPSLAARLEVGRSNEGALIYLSLSRGF